MTRSPVQLSKPLLLYRKRNHSESGDIISSLGIFLQQSAFLMPFDLPCFKPSHETLRRGTVM